MSKDKWKIKKRHSFEIRLNLSKNYNSSAEIFVVLLILIYCSMTIRYHKIIHCISSRDYVTIFNHQAMMETAAKRAAAPATSWLEPSSAAGAAGAAGAGVSSPPSVVSSPPSVVVSSSAGVSGSSSTGYDSGGQIYSTISPYES